MNAWMHSFIHTCVMHTCIHAYMHTFIHSCMHTCIHACIHAYMHTCIHAYRHTCIQAYPEHPIHRKCCGPELFLKSETFACSTQKRRVIHRKVSVSIVRYFFLWGPHRKVAPARNFLGGPHRKVAPAINPLFFKGGGHTEKFRI